MFRGRGLGQTNLVYDVAADACLPFMQHRNDFEPGRMPERLGKYREPIELLLYRRALTDRLSIESCHSQSSFIVIRR